MKKISNKEVIRLWRKLCLENSSKLDGESDKEGHDWHSLWAGFVIALGRKDLSTWKQYMKYGFAYELEEL